MSTILTNVQKELIGRHRFYLNKYKLSGVNELMAFMAGFSVISIAELQIGYDDNEWLLAGYALTTTLLVSIATFVIMVNSWIIPHFKSNHDDLEYMTPDSPYSLSQENASLSRQVNRQRLDKETRYFIQSAWLLASGGSVFLFTTNVIILSWIKFNNSRYAPLAATVILCPFLLVLVYFGIMFRKRLLNNQLFTRVDFDDDVCYVVDLNQNGQRPGPADSVV